MYDAEEATPGLDDVAPTNSILGGLYALGKLGSNLDYFYFCKK